MSEGVFVSRICDEMGLEYEGSDLQIDGLNLIGRNTAKTRVLSYVTNNKYIGKVHEDNSIMALLVSSEHLPNYKELILGRGGCIIESKEPEKIFYNIHDFLIAKGDFYKPVVKETVISSSAIIHPSAIVEDNVVIEENVKIGAFSLIKSGSIIRHDSVIGNYTIVGAEGYQVLRIDGVPYKSKHCGGVLIENNVEIGDYCSVCNTMFDGFTHVGSFSKIDSYCQIGHYVNIGKRVIITTGVIITGSVSIEDDCYIGAGATIMNKVLVHKGATVGIGSLVMTDVKPNVTVFGNPAKPIFFKK